MREIRPYQEIAKGSIRGEYRSGKKRGALVMPTGSGKTTTFADMIRDAVSRGKRCMVIVHRIELVDQVSDALYEYGVEHSFVAAGYQFNRYAHVHVANVMSLIKRLDKIEIPDFVVFDECHHLEKGNTFARVAEHFSNSYMLGTTATLRRTSGAGFDWIFQFMVEGPSVSSLIHAGYLSDFKIYGPPTVNTDGLHIRAGEFIHSEVSAVVDKPSVMGDAIEHYRKLADGAPAVAFCYSVEHSKATAAAFRAAGYKFEHIDGGFAREERIAVVRDFKAGRITGLCSCELVSEGFDVPRIHCGILLRPTASEALYLQQVGRCIRTSEGKTHATIIDHVGNASRHGLPDEDRNWTLDGRDKRAKKEAAKVNVKICPQCFYAQSSRRSACAQCQYEFPIEAREVAHVDGELVEIQRRQARRAQGTAQTLEDLTEIGRQRGYKNPAYWAKHVLDGRKRA